MYKLYLTNMKKIILLVFLLALGMSANCQKQDNQYPKPFKIDYGTKKSEVIKQMKALGFLRNKEYVGLIYTPVKFMGCEDASATFDFDLLGNMINCEVFCKFDKVLSAYMWYDDTVEKFLSKYKSGKKTQKTDFTNYSKPYNKDSITMGEIFKGIANREIIEYTDIEYSKSNHTILIHLEVTSLGSVRISFNDLALQKINENRKNKKDSNDI